MKDEITMKKFLALLLALCMLLGLMAGCGSTAESEAAASAAETSAEAPAEATEEEAETPEEAPAEAPAEEAVESKLPDTYPLISEEGMTVTAFQSTNPNLADLITTYGDLPWWQEVTARTGIDFEWTMASHASVEEQFNLLIAADDMPNLCLTANYYTDGITSAVDQEIFVNLADYIDEYAPDYKAVVERADVYPATHDADGKIIAFKA